MFKDIELSRDIMTTFKLHLDSRSQTANQVAATSANEEEDAAEATNEVDAPMEDEEATNENEEQDEEKKLKLASPVVVSGELELVVNVLTMGFWPTYPAIEVNLPRDVRWEAFFSMLFEI